MSPLVYEYEGKGIFRKHGLPMLDSVLIESADEAKAAYDKIGGTVIVKAQVLSGGRGKRGLIKLVHSASETEQIAAEIFARDDLKDGKVKRILIEQGADIAEEIYLGVLIDRSTKQLLAMVSTKGGIDIEQVAKTDPEAIAKISLPIDTEGLPYMFFEGLDSLGVEGKKKNILAYMLSKLTKILQEEDLMLVEINPFVFTSETKPIVLDARVITDDSALFRHKDHKAFASRMERYEEAELLAKEADIAFVKLEGTIGMISCGAGLSMATCDVVAHFGGSTANFLDIGGGASPEKVEAALHITMGQPEVKAVLINVFGGITRGDQVAEGIITALKKKAGHVPVVVRLIGTNDKEGVKILSEYGLDAYTEMEPAIKKVVELVN